MMHEFIILAACYLLNVLRLPCSIAPGSYAQSPPVHMLNMLRSYCSMEGRFSIYTNHHYVIE